jgi:putative membrane protein
MRKFLPLAALAALAAGCGTMHDTGVSARGGVDLSDMTPETAMPYVMMAGASDLYEIQSSQIAARRATRPEVRQYAQMLIQHHQMTTQQVIGAARASGLNPPPPRLLPMQREMLRQLRAATAGNFDRTYISQQVPAHQMALELHSNYSRNGDRPPLRNVAANAVPIVTQHLQQAQRMMGGM